MGCIIMVLVIGVLGFLGFSLMGPIGAIIGVVLGLFVVAKLNS